MGLNSLLDMCDVIYEIRIKKSQLGKGEMEFTLDDYNLLPLLQNIY